MSAILQYGFYTSSNEANKTFVCYKFRDSQPVSRQNGTERDETPKSVFK